MEDGYVGRIGKVDEVERIGRRRTDRVCVWGGDWHSRTLRGLSVDKKRNELLNTACCNRMPL